MTIRIMIFYLFGLLVKIYSLSWNYHFNGGWEFVVRFSAERVVELWKSINQCLSLITDDWLFICLPNISSFSFSVVSRVEPRHVVASWWRPAARESRGRQRHAALPVLQPGGADAAAGPHQHDFFYCQGARALNFHSFTIKFQKHDLVKTETKFTLSLCSV